MNKKLLAKLLGLGTVLVSSVSALGYAQTCPGITNPEEMIILTGQGIYSNVVVGMAITVHPTSGVQNTPGSYQVAFCDLTPVGQRLPNISFSLVSQHPSTGLYMTNPSRCFSVNGNGTPAGSDFNLTENSWLVTASFTPSDTDRTRILSCTGYINTSTFDAIRHEFRLSVFSGSTGGDYIPFLGPNGNTYNTDGSNFIRPLTDRHVIYPEVRVGLSKYLTGLAPSKSGDSVRYEFVVSATGATGASMLVLTDQFPSSLRYSGVVSSSPAGISCNSAGSTLTCNLPLIPANTTGYFVLEFVLSGNYAFGTPITNTGILSTGGVQTGLLITQPVSVQTITVAGLADLFIDLQTTTPLVYEANDVVSYTLTVGNSGSAQVTGASVVFSYSGALVHPVNIPQLYGRPGVLDPVMRTITWTGLNIATGATNYQTITITGLVAQNFMQGTTFTATGRIQMPAGYESRESVTITDTPTNNIDADANNVVTVQGRPDVTISKNILTSNPQLLRAGDIVSYRLVFANIGTAPAANVTITDEYDTVHLSGIAAEGYMDCPSSPRQNFTIPNVQTSPFSYTFPSMNPGCSGQIIFTGRLANDLLSGDDVINTGRIQTPTQELQGQTANNVGVFVFQIGGYTTLQVTKTLSGVIYPNGAPACQGASCPIYGSGDIVEYTIHIINSGNTTANVTVTDSFGVHDARFVNRTFIPSSTILVGPRSSGTIILRTTVRGDQVVPSFTNIVTGTDSVFGTRATGSTVGSILGRAYLTLTKTVIGPNLNGGLPNEIGDGPYYTGQTVTFALDITNTGTTGALVQVQDIAPANIAVNPATASVYITGGTTARVVVTGTLLNAIPGTYTNTGQLTGYQGIPWITAIQPAQEASFRVWERRELSITKELVSVTYADDDGGTCIQALQGPCPTYASGDLLQFRITVTNTGNAVATGVVVEDLVSSSFLTNLVSTDPSFDPGTRRWTNLTVPTGGSVQLYVTGTLQGETQAIFVNTGRIASVSNWTVADVYTPGAVGLSLTRQGRAYLRITKTTLGNTLNVGPYYPGQQVGFEITIENTGHRQATGISFTDIPHVSIGAPWTSNVTTVVPGSSFDPNNGSVANITVPAQGSVRFILTGTVVGSKGQYLGEFTNTGTIQDTTVSFIRQGTTLTVSTGRSTFTIWPRTELSITKTYLGMFGNGENPYGNWYGTRQQVGFRLAVTNSGNTQATNVDVQDIIAGALDGPNAFSGRFLSTHPLFDGTNRWNGLTIPMDGTEVIFLTGILNTERPQGFVNTGVLLENTECLDTTNPSNYEMMGPNSTLTGCQVVLRRSSRINGQIQGMAYINIQKFTENPGQCRVDPRQATNTYPSGALLTTIQGQQCLRGPALPGDTIGFRIRLTNTGTRQATGLSLQDILTRVSSYPNNSQTNMFDITGGLVVCQMNGGPCQTINVPETDLFNAPPAVFGVVSVPPMVGNTTGYVDIYFTGVLRFATGFDVNQWQTNTGIVGDPSLQSGVVIVGGTPSNPFATATSRVIIPEYMMGWIQKTVAEPQNTIGVLSGDRIRYDIRFANIGNTGMYFEIVDTLDQNVIHQSSYMNINLDPAFSLSIPGGTACGGSGCTPAPGAGSRANTLVKWYAPVRFLSVNGNGNGHISGYVIGTFPHVTNTIRLRYDDREFVNAGRFSASSSVQTNSRSQLEFVKEVLTSGPSMVGDPIGFKISVINTGRSAGTYTFTITDWFPGCLTFVTGNVPPTNWINGNNPAWQLTRTIPARSSFDIYFSGIVNNNTDGFLCTPLGSRTQFENRACLRSGLTYGNWGDPQGICDNATGVLFEGLFSITKTMLTPNPRFTGDTVAYRLYIANHSNSPGQISGLVDYRPGHILEFVSASIAPDFISTNQLSWNGSTIGTIPAQSGVAIIITGRVTSDMNVFVANLGRVFVNTGVITYGQTSLTDTSYATGRLLTGIYVYKDIVGTEYGFSGSQVTFRLRLRNYTTGGLAYYRITDMFPAGSDSLRYFTSDVVPTHLPNIYDGGDPTVVKRDEDSFGGSSILPGGERVITLTATVITDDNGFSPSLPNVARFEVCRTKDANSCYDVGVATAHVLPMPVLAIEKVMLEPYPKELDSNVSYDIIVRNIGAAPMPNVVIEEMRPERVFDQNSRSFAYCYIGAFGNVANCTSFTPIPNPISQGQSYLFTSGHIPQLANLPAGGKVRLRITARLAKYLKQGDVYCNTGKVYANNSPTATAVAQDCKTLLGTTDPWIEKTVESVTTMGGDGVWNIGVLQPEISGDIVQYRLRYGNTGNQTLQSGWIIRDIVPNELVYSGYVVVPNGGFTPTLTGGLIPGTNIVLLTGETPIPPQAQGEIILVFRLRANYQSGTCFYNTGIFQAASPDVGLEPNSYLANNTSSVRLCVAGRPDLWIRKEILTGQYANRLGDPIVYRITFGNSGTRAIVSGWMIADTLEMIRNGYVDLAPDTFSYTTPQGVYVAWDPVTSTLVWTGQTLATGSSMSITITGILNRDLFVTQGFCNTGLISLLLQDPQVGLREVTQANNTGGNACVAPNAGYVVRKTPAVQYSVSGGLATFTLSFTNNTTGDVCIGVTDDMSATNLSDGGKFYLRTGGQNLNEDDYVFSEKDGIYVRSGVLVTPNTTYSLTFTAAVLPNTYAFNEIVNKATFYVINRALAPNGDCSLLNRQTTNPNQNLGSMPKLATLEAFARVLPIPDVEVEKVLTSPHPQKTGDRVSYRLRVTNIGGRVATGLIIWDNFVDGNLVTNETVTVTQGTLTQVNWGRLYQWSGNLQPGESFFITIAGDYAGYSQINTPICNVAGVQTEPTRWYAGGYITDNKEDICNGLVVNSLSTQNLYQILQCANAEYRIGRKVHAACARVDGIPDLELQKMFVTGSAFDTPGTTGDWPRISGDVVYYRLTYRNIGTAPVSGFSATASGWTIVDTYPPFLTYSGIVFQNYQANPVGVLTGTEVFHDPGTRTLIFKGTGTLLPNGANGILVLAFVLNNNYQSYLANPANCFLNTGTIRMPQGQEAREVVTQNNTASADRVCVRGQADLWIRKEVFVGPYTSEVGQAVTYRITYGNSGTDVVTGFTIYDDVPPQFSDNTDLLISHPHPVTEGTLALRWTGLQLGFLTGIAPGQGGTIVFTGYLNQAVGDGPICNTGRIEGDAFGIQDANPANNIVAPEAACFGTGPDLMLIKNISGSANILRSGDVITYTLFYANTGTTDFETGAVDVRDYLPPALRYVPGSTRGFTLEGDPLYWLTEPTVQQTPLGTTLTWNLKYHLRRGYSGLIVFDAVYIGNLSGGTSIVNTGCITLFPNEIRSGNNCSSIAVRVGYLPDVWIRKSIVSTGVGRLGSPVVFRLDFGNNGVPGSGDATGVIIRDTLPSGFVVNSSNACSVWFLSTPSGIDEFGDLTDPGYQATTLTCTTYMQGGLARLQVSGSVAGGSGGYVLLTGYLGFQPLERFCFTNTGQIRNGYRTNPSDPSTRVNVDYNMANNDSSVSACLDPDFGVTVEKVAYPERNNPIDPTLGLDISGAIVGFTINIVNTGDIPVTGLSLRDVLSQANLLTWLSSSVGILPPNNLLSPVPYVLQPGSGLTLDLTGVLLRRNFASFVNAAGFRFQVGTVTPTLTGTVQVQEPLVCGDYILAGNEQCEALQGGNYLVADPSVLATRFRPDLTGARGTLLEGLACVDCRIRLQYVANTMEFCDTTPTLPICQRASVTGNVFYPNPVLSITKTASRSTVQTNETVTYTITVQNTQSDAINVVLTDLRPSSQMTLVSATTTRGTINTGNQNTITVAIGTMLSGETVSVTLVGRVTAPAGSVITNTATVSANGIAPLSSTVTITVAAVPAPTMDVQITKTITPNTYKQLYTSGDSIAFQLTVTNPTTTTLTNVVLTDIRPSTGIQYLSSSVGSGILGSYPSWTIPTLSPNTSVGVTLYGRVTSNQTMTVVNTGQASFVSGTTTITRYATAQAMLGQLVPGDCQYITPKNVTLVAGQQQTYTCFADADAGSTAIIRGYCFSGDTNPTQVVGNRLDFTCSYPVSGTYTPYCTVGSRDRRDACTANVLVGSPTFDVCGNGIKTIWEQCDMGPGSETSAGVEMNKFTGAQEYLCLDSGCTSVNYNFRRSDGRFVCKNGCTIEAPRQTAITPPACAYSDTPISIQEGEVLPFWRGMEIVGGVDSCVGAPNGSIYKPSMQCTFNVYGGDNEAYRSPVLTMTVPCNQRSGKEVAEKAVSSLESYAPGFVTSLNHAYGIYQIPFDETYDEYGEYKVSLESVEYNVCENNNLSSRRIMSKRVCQVNFTLTRPYFLQKGAQSMKASDTLDDFYMMDGRRVSFAQKFMNNFDTVQVSTYNGGAKLAQIENLFAKYDRKSILETKGNVQKVRGKNIFILRAPAGDSITYTENVVTSTPLTVLVYGDLVIKGDVKTPTMFVVKGKVSFEPKDCNQTQVVNGIIVARDGFKASEKKTANTVERVGRKDEDWCLAGNLKVKGLLIGKNIEKLIESKRSNLNNRFVAPKEGKSLNERRRELIYQGAAVYVEHNPQLRLQLPPGASEIDGLLKAYRN